VNWRLVLALSLFGLVMSVATISAIPSSAEPIFWGAIFIVCAIVIARLTTERHFLHGLMVGLVNSLWITGAHIIMFDHYISHHPQERTMMNAMPLRDSPRLMMAITGPVIGVISGSIIGLLAYVAGILMRRSENKIG
jgi:hypothetical protein